jgi:hypothetical protein
MDALICVCYLKSLMDCLPIQVHAYDRPTSSFVALQENAEEFECVVMSIDIISLEFCLHPPKIRVLVSGWWHLLHIIVPCALCLVLHR